MVLLCATVQRNQKEQQGQETVFQTGPLYDAIVKPAKLVNGMVFDERMNKECARFITCIVRKQAAGIPRFISS